MNRRLLLFPVVAAVAFVGGCFVRRSMSPPTVAASAAVPTLQPEESAARFSKLWSSALAETDAVSRTESMLAALNAAGRASMRDLATRHMDDPVTLQLILQRWTELNPLAAAAWVRQALREGRVPQEAMESVAEVWAARDPAALTAWLREPSQKALQFLLLPKLTGAVFARDPAAAFNLAKDFPEQWSLPLEAMSWVRRNPAAAARILGELPLNERSFALARQAAAAWAEQDGPAAAAWCASLSKQRGPAATILLQSALNTWAGLDPAAATAFAATRPHGDRLAYTPLQQWATKDPAAALAWITANAHPSEQLSLIHGTMLATARKDLTAATALVSQMPEGGPRDKATAALSEVWSASDPPAALIWFTAQPGGPGRDEAVVRSARTWAEKDSAAAAAWALSTPDGSLPANTWSSIMDSLRRDPAAAYVWLNELPPAAARDAAPRLLSSNAEGAAAALALPAGPSKPLVLDFVLNRFIRHSPDIAITQASSYTPAQRAVLRGFVEAAEPVPTGTSSGSLTAEKRAELLRQLR